jgi:CRP-like cAMP-binding protein
VKLLIESPDQSPHEISELGKGDIFGIPSLIGNHRRTETARAYAETRLLGFFRPDLNRFLREFPKVGGKLFLAISRHITARQISQVTDAQTDAEKIEALKILHCVNDISEVRKDNDHGA